MSLTSVWKFMFNTDWSINISVHVGLSTSVCVVFPGTQCVCLSWSWYVIVTFPVGRSLHDSFHLLDCPYLFMSTAWVEVTSDFIHTQWGSLCLSLSFLLLFMSLQLTPSPSGGLLLFSVSYHLQSAYTFQFVWQTRKKLYRHPFVLWEFMNKTVIYFG